MLTLVLLLLVKVALAQNPSPCPSVLKYEPRGNNDDDRWSAVVTLKPEEKIEGVWLRIQLDQPADILINWFGESTTLNNEEFLIKNKDYVVKEGANVSVKFTVKYNTARIVPSVTKIRLNGIVICTITQAKQPVTSETPPVEAVSTGSRTNVQDICGTVPLIAKPLIYNGKKARDGEWPWHIGILKLNGAQLSYTCGGSLISDRYALTAAHCITFRYTKKRIEAHKLLLRLGSNDLKEDGPGSSVVQASKLEVHPEYDPVHYYNDLGVIKLAVTVTFTNFIRPICLWEDEIDLDMIISKVGTVVGWGIDENNDTSKALNQADIPIVSLSTCLYLDRTFYSQFTSKNTYCAGYTNGTSVCPGDSGGSMVFPKKGSDGKYAIWQIRGIVSVSPNPGERGVCKTDGYVVFTDVAQHLDWIKGAAQLE